MNEREYGLYVPHDATSHGIRTGSAIVGEEREGRIDVDYEGGGASNVQTFEQKILHAAGRRSQRYPTVARRSFASGELVRVGSVGYDEQLRRWVITGIDDPERLTGWAPGPHVTGGSDALVLEAAGSRWSHLNPAEQIRIQTAGGDARATAEAIMTALRARNA